MGKRSPTPPPPPAPSADPEAFTLAAILAGRTDRSKGIHVVFSGFNAAFRKTFPGQDPRDVTKRMAAAGRIVLRPCRGGAMLYLPEDAPAKSDGGDAKADRLLKSMGIL